MLFLSCVGYAFVSVCLYVPCGHLLGKGGGGTLIFSHIRRLGLFWGFKILNFNIFGGFQKNRYFLEYEDFVDIFGGVIGLVLG